MAGIVPFFQFLTEAGDGTGAHNHVGNYSVGASRAIACPGSSVMYLYQLVIMLADGAQFIASNYGGLAPLTNGTEIIAYNADGTVKMDITGGRAIKTNAQWACITFENVHAAYGSGEDFLILKVDFVRSNGRPLGLNEGDHLDVEFNDDLTGLVAHTFNIQGELHPG